MKPRVPWSLILVVCWLVPETRGVFQAKPVPVEPAELEHRADLVGREVQVDDRVAYYVPRNGTGDDELQLKRTPVTFRVPRRLRPSTATRMSAVVVSGVLNREGGRLVCAVTDIRPVLNDLDRLERGLKDLGPKDFETRKQWARWAERRASEFRDEALMKRTKAVEAEALRLESERKRLAVDPPQEWLAIAQEARRRQVAEPEPSAQGHRALRARLAAAPAAAGLKVVLQEIESFFPQAATDQASARVNLAAWEAPYANDPAGAYRSASEPIRRALDRRLWADAKERLLEGEAGQDLASALAASEQAATQLPEKSGLPARLLQKALDSTRQNLPVLRRDEVQAVAQTLREKLKRPDEAQRVLRDWLEMKRGRLSATDADGPVSLAELYDEWLHDRVTAVELLRRAWRIDPTSPEIAEAFRTRGFRKAGDEWVEAVPEARAGTASPAPAALPDSLSSPSLRGLTAEEVQQRLGGKPNRISFSGSRLQLVEQWIYLDTKNVRYVNLLHIPGDVKPRVAADYTLPRTSLKGGLGSAR